MTIESRYDVAGRVASVTDGTTETEYAYTILGQLASETQSLAGLSDDVTFEHAYDVRGLKTSTSAKIGATDDYVNEYEYDNLGRLTKVTQQGQGGNAVAEKRVDLAYADDGLSSTLTRYADVDGTKMVAATDYAFDQLGRTTDITHERGATEFADYDIAWDVASRITDFDFASLIGDDGDAGYTYDDTDQLIASDYESDWQDDEAYSYDENGNRTNTGYTTGDHNRLLSDGVHNYQYDNEGNRTRKTTIATGEYVDYEWDHRNRLTKVTFRNASGTAVKIVEHAYDHGHQWIRKTLDTNADGTIESSNVFVHDAGQIVFEFEKTGTGDASANNLDHRYLWGGSVDQILADERVDDGSVDDVHWTLTDPLNSVRDVVQFRVDESVWAIKHIAYDGFGNATSVTIRNPDDSLTTHVTGDLAATADSTHLFTARPFDIDTDLQQNGFRWYDPVTGTWWSVDPIGFQAGDANLYRYCGSQPVFYIDPTGMFAGEHHWFPQALRTLFEATDCRNTDLPGNFIDMLTTDLGAWQKGQPHQNVHNNPFDDSDKKWNERVEEIYDDHDGDCCSLLTNMKFVIETAYAWLRRSPGGSQLPLEIEFIDFRTGAPTGGMDMLDDIIDSVCGDRCPEPDPIDLPNGWQITENGWQRIEDELPQPIAPAPIPRFPAPPNPNTLPLLRQPCPLREPYDPLKLPTRPFGTDGLWILPIKPILTPGIIVGYTGVLIEGGAFFLPEVIVGGAPAAGGGMSEIVGGATGLPTILRPIPVPYSPWPIGQAAGLGGALIGGACSED